MIAVRALAWGSLAGALIGVGGAPLELSFLTLCASAALLAAITPQGKPATPRTAILAGLAMGVTAQAISMYWVVGLLVRFGHFPLVVALLVGALLFIGQSLPYVVAAWLASALLRRGALGWLVVPAMLTISLTVAPAIFPWRYGLSQLPFLSYAQVAELGGLPLLDWLVATVGCGALSAVRNRRAGPAIVATLALLLPPAYGALRLPVVRAERAAAPRLAVGVAQPNVSIEEKHDPRRFLAQLRLLQEQTRALEAEGAELVVWPETAYRYPILRDRTRDRDGPLALLGGGVRGPLIVGVVSTSGTPRRYRASDETGRTVSTFEMAEDERYNSAVAVTADGRFVGLADKVHLLAFGEYTPFWDVIPWLHVFPRGMSPGRGAQMLEIGGARVGVLNCYEDLLYEHVRTQARYGPDFWVNVTNNTWFGDTSAPHLHHMNARLRAIETRRDLVRAVNTGVSGHTAATGEDLARTEAFVSDRFIADVRLLSGSTPYVRFGDWVSPLLAGAILASLVAYRRRRLT